MTEKNNVIKAINKNVRSGARKANLVLNFIKGKKADVAIRDLEFTRKKVANDIKKISQDNKAIYGALLNEKGWILDDLIIYHAMNKFRLVSNCSTRQQNRNWY